MARLVDEVTEELRTCGWKVSDRGDVLVAAEVAKRLDVDEKVLDALPGRQFFGGFPGNSICDAWLVITSRRLFAVATDLHWFWATPRLRQLSEVRLSDILETQFEFTSGKGSDWELKGHNVTVNTLAARERLNVPLERADENRVRRFVDMLRAAPATASSNAAGADGGNADLVDRLERLAVLRSQGALTDAEFEAAKQKLLAL